MPPIEHVDALGVEPLARLGGGDVGLVLVVGDEHLDLLAGDRAAHVGDRHPDRLAAGRAVDVGVQARQVADEADLDHVARDLRLAAEVPNMAASARPQAGTSFLSFMMSPLQRKERR